jgi:LemA protein
LVASAAVGAVGAVAALDGSGAKPLARAERGPEDTAIASGQKPAGDTLKEERMTRVRNLVVVGLVAGAALSASGCSYNTFVGQEEAIKAQWAQVENQLQRRNDLIPNLVESVKGITQQEQEVFGRIADSRAKMSGATTPEARMAAANEQTSALRGLLAVIENYPQLRSSESFNRLMDELSGTENRIAVERMRYNERVQQYNTTRRRFPSNITAGIFGFKAYQLFDAPTAAEQVPRVNFGKPPA